MQEATQGDADGDQQVKRHQLDRKRGVEGNVENHGAIFGQRCHAVQGARAVALEVAAAVAAVGTYTRGPIRVNLAQAGEQKERV